MYSSTDYPILRWDAYTYILKLHGSAYVLTMFSHANSL